MLLPTVLLWDTRSRQVRELDWHAAGQAAWLHRLAIYLPDAEWCLRQDPSCGLKKRVVD